MEILTVVGVATISLTRCARNYPNFATNSTVHIVSLAAVVRFKKKIFKFNDIL